MTREAAHAAARALLDAMAGTSEGEWLCLEGAFGADGYGSLFDKEGDAVVIGCGLEDGNYIARACPARLGPVLRALMGED